MAEELGIYRCERCNKSYTKEEFKNLKKEKCPCGGKPKEVTPVRKFQLKHADFQSGVERFYYWVLEYLSDKGYSLTKIKDVYTASEASDFWGDLERRKQFQEEQAMKYLANIGGMMKSLFQMIHELRVLDERLDHYKGREDNKIEDDIALKGIWIDRVEGGAQKPTSIYGMAAQRGFITLPDYFFRIFVKKKEDIQKNMTALRNEGSNEKLIEILERKLAEYLHWVDNTKKELEQGKKFKLMYLRQHFHIIRMYLEWVKPYIKQVERFQSVSREGSKARNWLEIIRAAEGAVIDLELFGVTGKDPIKQCVRVVFHYSIVPEMLYRKEYQKGAIHVGVSMIDFESYLLTDEDIKKYKEQQVEDDVEAVKAVDASIEAMREDIVKYLKEAHDSYYVSEDGKVKEDKEEKKKDKNFWGSLGKFFKGKKSGPKLDFKKSSKSAKDDLWDLYDEFKKNFEMVRW